MRSIGLMAAVTGTLVLAIACGGDSGTSPTANTAPVASFTMPSCTIDVACAFASTSTDDAGVTAWSWDFDGDGTPDAATADASFTYTTAGTFAVSLTASDAQGLSQTTTASITIDTMASQGPPPPPPPPPPPVNTPPTAGFTSSCDGLTCGFASTSTDAAPGTIASYAWTFGDGDSASVSNPTHSYAVTDSTAFIVTLTVTDNDGAVAADSQTVAVVPPNVPPTAGFTHTCATTNCSFTSTSTDAAPGTIVSFAWTFGDGATASIRNPSHTYSISTTTDFTVTHSVTDDRGAIAVDTQTVRVSPAPPPPPPPSAEGCTTSGTRVDCIFTVVSKSTFKLKLLGLSCDLSHQRVTVPPPIGDQSFLAVCDHMVGDSTRIFGGTADTAVVFEAGSQVTIRFNQGTVSSGAPPLGAPSATFTGSFPDWTINFEDGENAGQPGEPDFADVVLGLKAVPHP